MHRRQRNKYDAARNSSKLTHTHRRSMALDGFLAGHGTCITSLGGSNMPWSNIETATLNDPSDLEGMSTQSFSNVE
jgi:hypothetical protein